MNNKLIMIVDDMLSSLEILKLMLSREGFNNVLIFDCPLRALHEIDQGIIPDVIITDFHMREMDGLQFLESAQSDKCKIPSIIISGDTESIQDCPDKYIKIDKGDFGFLKKLLSAITVSLQVKSREIKRNDEKQPRKSMVTITGKRKCGRKSVRNVDTR